MNNIQLDQQGRLKHFLGIEGLERTLLIDILNTAVAPCMNNIQLDQQGRLKHFLGIEGLERTLLIDILNTAASFLSIDAKAVKKAPILRGN